MSRIDIVLIRHGWSEGNEKRLLYGRLDVPLTEEGKNILRGYHDTYDYPVTERYYSSPLLRARQTFELLYPDVTLDGILDDFTEIDFGDAEGENEKFAESYKSYFARWSKGEKLWNGETIFELRARTDRAVRNLLDLLHRDGIKSATVVCHSGTIKSILMNFGFMSSDFMEVFVPQGMGYGISFDYDGRNLKVLGYKEEPVKLECKVTC